MFANISERFLSQKGLQTVENANKSQIVILCSFETKFTNKLNKQKNKFFTKFFKNDFLNDLASKQ